MRTHLFVTGVPGCGKTTLIQRVLERLGALGGGGNSSSSQAGGASSTCVAGGRRGDQPGGSGSSSSTARLSSSGPRPRVTRAAAATAAAMGSAAAAHPTPGGTGNTGGLLPHGVIVSGFYTQEVRGGSGEGERLGFDIVTLDGSRAPLSRTSTSSTAALSRTQLLPSVGKYSVYTQSFEALALPALLTNLGGQQDTPRLVIIDEVGKMELLCPNFFPAVVAALDNPSVIVLGSVPVPRYGHAIPQVEALKSRVDVQVVAVNRANRDALVEELSRRVAAEILALVHAA